jgi:hypothetical protein
MILFFFFICIFIVQQEEKESSFRSVWDRIEEEKISFTIAINRRK